jgi:hypothetical protein
MRKAVRLLVLTMAALSGAVAWSQEKSASAPASEAASDAGQIEEKNDGLDYIASWEVMVDICSARYPELKQVANDFWGTRMPKAYREQLLTSQAERYKRVKAEVRAKLMTRQDEILSQCHTMFRR